MQLASNNSARKNFELLAPVGTWEMCQAAVHNGAQAVYVGMPGFNARGRTEDFSLEFLQKIITYCHLYGVKVHLAFNILIFEKELDEIIPLISQVLQLKPDVFIVQDIGLIRLIRAIAPQQVIHASTQMTVTHQDAITLTADLNLQRYVLARENSLSEIKTIRQNTTKELEVFVHGALCVAYSGQCLTSESLGGRSANRGQCAQACRLPYQLVVDGKIKDTQDRQYYVSPKDYCALTEMPALMEMGIDSFKIEGRLKTPQYVAASAQQYSSAIRDYQQQVSSAQTTSAQPYQLALTYSRSFYSGWLHGVNHQKLVDGRYGNHHGLEIGEVLGVVEQKWLEIKLNTLATQQQVTLNPGDGILLSDFASKHEIGGAIYELSVRSLKPLPNTNILRVSMANDFPLHQVRVGSSVFWNSAPALEKGLQKTWTHKDQLKKVPVTMKLAGKLGAPLQLWVQDPEGREVTVRTEQNLMLAQQHALNIESLKNELGALGGSIFVLTDLIFEITGPEPLLFLPQKELKHLRQKATQQLTELRQDLPQVAALTPAEGIVWLKEARANYAPHPMASAICKLNILIREKQQLEALQGLPIETVYLDFEHGKDYREFLPLIRQMGFKVGIATTRILKPAETYHLKMLESLQPDVILVRNLAALQGLKNRGFNLVGDFSLNITNSLAAHYFLQKDLQRFTPSYDLNQWQLLDMLEHIPGQKCEVTIHQYMPSFHMEHCVFAAFLSTGTSFKDCGLPCEKHRVELRDPQGRLHPLKPDQECRNTMFTGTAQSAARLIPLLQQKGVRYFRMEALFEEAEQLRHKIKIYSELMVQNISVEQAIVQLGLDERYGLSEGQLLNNRVYRDRKNARADLARQRS